MSKKGKFIVLDGNEGSGKKTQSELLIKILKHAGYKTAYFDFPQYGKSFFGRVVGSYLNGDFGSEASPYLASLAYAGDRWQASDKIRNNIKAGNIVVSNRYIQANMGVQTAKIKTVKQKEAFLRWLEEMEYQVYKIPKADLVLYLYVPFEISQQLILKKSVRNYTKKKRDLYESNLDLLKKIDQNYLWLSKKYQDWELIDCTDKVGNILSIEEIAFKIKRVLSKRLGLILPG